MSEKAGSELRCMESCSDESPVQPDTSFVDRQLEEGLPSELSCCGSFFVDRFGLDDPSSAAVDDGHPEYHKEPGYVCFCYYLSTTQATTGLTQSQRATLVDSMISIAEQLGLTNDTLFTAVAVLDRYLSVVPVSLALLQPISVACLWIASKYEELTALSAAVFAPFMLSPDGQSLGSETHAVQLLVQLEMRVLQALDYRLANIVTTKAYKHWIIQRLWGDAAAVAKLTQRQHQQLYSLTSYLTEVSLLEYQLLQWPPNMLAAAAYAVAQILLGLHLEDESLLHVTGFKYDELRIVMQFLCSLHATLYQALSGGVPYNVTRKYCREQLCCVAAVPPLTQTDPRLAAQ